MAANEALDRIREACKGKPAEGVKTMFSYVDPSDPKDPIKKREGVGFHQIKLKAGDVVDVAKPLADKDKKVAELLFGASNNKPESVIYLSAPDVHHLIAAADGKLGGD